MKIKNLVYGAANLAAIVFLVWITSMSAKGFGALTQVLLGVGLVLGYCLVSAAITLKLREVNDRIAELVAQEVQRDDVTALADSLNQVPEELVDKLRAYGPTFNVAPYPFPTFLADPPTGRHALPDVPNPFTPAGRAKHAAFLESYGRKPHEGGE